jgi:lysophospholipase L1-like esterase
MLRNIVIVAGILLGALVLIEASALLIMKSSVSRYADYWKGRATQQGEFVYIALGDSAAQGIGATSPEKGYVGLVASRLEQATGQKVRVINLSATGAKLDDVLHKQIPQLDQYKPDLITMEIGANDLTSYNSTSFSTTYAKILDLLPADKTVVATMPYFGGRIDARGNDSAASQAIASLAVAKGFRLADLYAPLRAKNSPRIYAADYFHPSNYGYTIWADAFWKAKETVRPEF